MTKTGMNHADTLQKAYIRSVFVLSVLGVLTTLLFVSCLNPMALINNREGVVSSKQVGPGKAVQGIGSVSGSISAHQVVKWRHNRKAAVTVTFDDGYASWLVNALPLLNSRDIKATFFVVSSWIPVPGTTLTQWQQLVSQGHEIAGHTVTHVALPGLAVADARRELSDSQTRINELFSGQQCTTMSYPSNGQNQQVRQLAAEYYLAVRGGATEQGGYLNHYETERWWSAVDFSNVAGYSIEQPDYSEIAYLLNSNDSLGSWFAVYFHAVETPEQIERLRTFLDDVKARDVWIDTFGSVARYMQERKSSSIALLGESDSEIRIDVTTSLDASVSSYPLTIRSNVPSDWQTVIIQQGSTTQEVDAVVESGANVAYFDVTPNNGPVSLSRKSAMVLSLAFDEGSGSVARDGSGNGKDGRIDGASYTPAAAVGNYALLFDGADSVNVEGSSLRPSQMTVALWVRHEKDTSAADIGGILQGACGDGYSAGFRILDYDNRPQAQIQFATGDPTRLVGVPFVTGAWTHLALWYDHGHIRLYQDGVVVREVPESRDIVWSSTPAQMQIGHAQWYFTGAMDEVRMFNYALTPQQVADLYRERQSPSTLLSLAFDEGSGSVARDGSGNGKDGRIDGASYTPAAAVGNYALLFDGADSVNVEGSSLRPSQMTVALWVRHEKDTSAADIGGILQGACGDGYSAGFRILDYDNRPQAQIQFATGDPTRLVGVPFVTGAWTHLALWYDHSHIRLYQDGVVVREVPESRDIVWSSTPAQMQIGHAQWYFTGAMDEVRMFSYALTPQQVADLSNRSR